jgi:hypothetical protein
MTALRALPLLLLATGCAGGDRACTAMLTNASRQPLEQVFLARQGAEGWGADLVGQAELRPGGTLPIRFPGEGAYGLRAVWADGQAVELRGVEACRITRLTVRDGALQAE